MQALLSRTRLRGAPLLLVSATSLPAYLILKSDSFPSPATPHKQPLRSLLRSYVVYSLCSIPPLVDNSPTILNLLSTIPGLKQLTFGLVRVTFFDQFVGGETPKDTLPLVKALRAANKGIIYNYSVEVNEQEALGSSSKQDSQHNPVDTPPHKRTVEEILRCIDVAGEFEDALRGAREATVPYRSMTGMVDTGRGSWVAIKLTAMLPNAHALISFSKCITSSREADKRRGKQRALESDYVPCDRLIDISKGTTHLPATLVPFPGCPRVDDMEILHQSTEKPLQPPMNMTTQDANDVFELYQDLVRICARAQERGVKLLLDAEYSWYQPAIDALTLALMREFNARSPPNSNARTSPLVYGTYQAYLRRTPLQLALNLRDARENGYALGVKLVRGAYHPCEVSSHAAARSSESNSSTSLSISPDSKPPVWPTKLDTDASYDDCLRLVISAVKDDIEHSGQSGVNNHNSKGAKSIKPPRTNPGHVGIGVLFGTHNWNSCNLVLDELKRVGLAKSVTTLDEAGKEMEKLQLDEAVTDRVSIGQLYGMCDDLTEAIVRRTISAAPLVVKYVPYGGIEEVLPYLSRRALENKSVLGAGGASRERQNAGREIRKRLFGFLGVA